MSIGFPEIIGPVLVIDDDDVYRRELTQYLSANGVSVIALPTALHATKFIQSQPWNWYPTMIFTDIVMNGMGGYQFIRSLDELYPRRRIPVIVISKLESGIDIGEAESAGAAAYITKPLNYETLAKTVSKVLEKGRKKMHVFTSIRS